MASCAPRLSCSRWANENNNELSKTTLPVSGFSAVMRDGENSDRGGRFEIDDVIGEALHRNSSDRQRGSQPGHPGACAREFDDPMNRGVNLVEEFNPKVRATAFIPSTGVTVLRVRLVLKANARGHRLRNSASARLRTSSQGMPSDSPAMTRRARLSISAAHAASTSALSSAPASSRLARSSAATSARSSIGNVRASRRRSCAREVIWPF